MVRCLNLENEVFRFVESGKLDVDVDGRIWKIGSVRKRAENCFTGGYMSVRVTIEGVRVGCLAHRLVWRVFRGEIPSGYVVNHMNGVKSDNTLTNLEVVTSSENVLHAMYVLGVNSRMRRQGGSLNAMSKLTAETIAEIRKRYALGGVTQAKLAEDFGVNLPSDFQDCTWRSVG